MNTYFYAEHCYSKKGVVNPQPEGKDRECDDYWKMSLTEADHILSLSDKGCAVAAFWVRSAKAVLRFQDNHPTARRIMRKHGIDY